MPFINVKTNADVPADKAKAIKSALGLAITAIPGKSEGWLMVGIEDNYKLFFQGYRRACRYGGSERLRKRLVKLPVGAYKQYYGHSA